MSENTDIWIVMHSWGTTYCARKWSNRMGHMIATASLLQCDSLEEIRTILDAQGCTILPKQIGKVIEMWVEPLHVKKIVHA